MSKGGGTQTTTAVKELPPEVMEAMMKLWNGGQDVLGNWISEPAYRVAGFTPDQLYAMDAMRFQVDNALNNPAYRPTPKSAGAAAQADFAAIDPAKIAQFTGAGPMAQGQFTSAGPMAQASATDAAGGRLSGDAYKEFMNPYINSVIDPAISKMRRERDITDAGIGARAAAGAAYGGSRGALERSQNARAHNEQVATLVPQLMAQGFDKATASAMANAQMQQQTGLANAQARNNIALSNAQMFNQGALADAAQRNSMATSNAQMFNQGALADAAQRNSMATSNAQMMNAIATRNAELLNSMRTSNAQEANRFNLTDADMMNRYTASMLNDQWNREMQAINSLMGFGGMQQGLGQKSLDIPIETLKFLAALRPQSEGAGTTTQTSPDNSPSSLQSLLGFGAATSKYWFPPLMAALGFPSDRDMKTNIEKLGKDPATGEMMYAYDYKADVAKAKKDGAPMPPKRVGPMAQDIEKTQPERVRKIGGKRVVAGI